MTALVSGAGIQVHTHASVVAERLDHSNTISQWAEQPDCVHDNGLVKKIYSSPIFVIILVFAWSESRPTLRLNARHRLAADAPRCGRSLSRLARAGGRSGH